MSRRVQLSTIQFPKANGKRGANANSSAPHSYLRPGCTFPCCDGSRKREVFTGINVDGIVITVTTKIV